MIRRTYPLELQGSLGPRQVRVRASTGELGRDGMIVHPGGIDLTHYRKNPVMLWSHNPAAPVARATMLGMEGDDLVADVEFAPQGISSTADEICGLVKAGIINAVSIGFEPTDSEPLDPKKPRGGQRVMRSELMEISFVSVPADREAVVLQRADAEKPQGDYGDVEYADPGHQADKKPRYPLDTEEHIKAAWDYIHQEKNAGEYTAAQVTEIKAKIVAAWKEKIDKDGPPAARAARKPRTRAARRAGPAPMIRGMYGVGELAWLMECLSGLKHSTEIESALEGDDSAVPAMLAKALQDVGAALIAMTAEEVAELIGDTEVDPGDEMGDLDEPDVVLVMAALTPATRQLRLGYARAKAAMTRAGAKHSADTMRSFREATDHIDEGMQLARSAMGAIDRGKQMIGELMSAGDGSRASVPVDIQFGVPREKVVLIASSEHATASDADFRRRQAERLRVAAAQF